jgi:hypothetical protein
MKEKKSLFYFSLNVQRASGSSDSVENKSALQGNPLMRDQLDDFERNHSSLKRSNVMKLAPAISDHFLNIIILLTAGLVSKIQSKSSHLFPPLSQTKNHQS